MSEPIDRLLETSHRVDLGRVRDLDEREVSALRAVASGERRHPSRSRAMAMFAIAQPEEARRMLVSVVRGRRESSLVRATAAGLLGRLGRAEVEETMLGAVDEEDDSVVRLNLVTSLGKMGSHRSADRLAELAQQDPKEEVRKQAAFARMLVVHRDGGEHAEPVVPEAGRTLRARDRMFDFDWQRARDDEARQVVETLHGDDYGVDVSRPPTFALDCPPTRFVVLLDTAHAARDLGDVATRRPALAGLVTERSPIDTTYSVRWTILVGPERDQAGAAYVAIYRTDGVLAFRGSARAEGDATTFSLATHDAPGNVVVDVQGRLAGTEITFERRRTAQRIAKSRVPTSFSMPNR